MTCTAVTGTKRYVPDPVIVSEVLSPSSGQDDRTVRLLEYQAVPTICRDVVMDQAKVAATVHRRADEGAWTTDPPLAAGTALVVPEIDITIPVDDLYENVTFQG